MNEAEARPIEPTPVPVLDETVARLRLAAQRWPRVGLRERVDFLNACLAGVERTAREWVRLACAAQRVPLESAFAGENWLSGPWITARDLRLLADALRASGRPAPPRLQERGDQWVADVVPAGALERVLFTGIRAEVRMMPGAAPSQGRIYRSPREERTGAVSLVLGAGNISSIGPRDLLHQLFVEDRVVVLKMHPVNEYLGPIFENAFSCLIEAGYLEIVYGGAEVGDYLCRHPGVDAIHLTGSHHTHDAIVWGADERERERRRAADDPRLVKPVTAELGCVSPVIVVPGDWSAAEMETQARSVAGMVTNNASFNCNAAKLVITHADWPQRDEFLRRLRLALAATPTRPAYYPGARGRFEAFVSAHSEATLLGSEPAAGHLPWTLASGVEPAPGSSALGREAFCGVLAETPLPAPDGAAFLGAAVALCNEHVWGSLSAMLLVDPRTERALDGAVDRAVDALAYGGVAVNCWSALLFALCAPSWGAWPGNDRYDVGSGIGVVGGNTYLFDAPQKSVVRMPFEPWPTPSWFASHRQLSRLGRLLTRFEGAPGWHRLPAIALAAARG